MTASAGLSLGLTLAAPGKRTIATLVMVRLASLLSLLGYMVQGHAPAMIGLPLVAAAIALLAGRPIRPGSAGSAPPPHSPSGG